jgi:hypothetical protein
MDKSLGVVACYYNPYNYQSKYNNFVKFYKNINLYYGNIKVVELISEDSQLTLPEEFNSSKFSSNQNLWHKENLLNIGIQELLNEGYENIAWLDGDILFENSYWVEDAVNSLKKHKLVQLFSVAGQSDSYSKNFHNGCVREWKSTGNIISPNNFYHTGYAWAANSSVLSECLLYDKALIGGGDSLIWLASFNNGHINFYELMKSHPISLLGLDDYFKHYLSWSAKWGRLVDQSIGFVYGNIECLSHGSVSDRNYISRYKHLINCNYSPAQDIFYNNNIIQTNNNKLVKALSSYLKSRNEDEVSVFNKIINKFHQLGSKINLYNLEQDLRSKI